MEFIEISVFCRKNNYAWFKYLKVEKGISSGELLQMIKGFADFPLDVEITSDLAIGIFAKKIDFSYTMQDGDRLEIYEPLILTPAEARKLRAEIQIKKAKQQEQVQNQKKSERKKLKNNTK